MSECGLNEEGFKLGLEWDMGGKTKRGKFGNGCNLESGIAIYIRKLRFGWLS